MNTGQYILCIMSNSSSLAYKSYLSNTIKSNLLSLSNSQILSLLCDRPLYVNAITFLPLASALFVSLYRYVFPIPDLELVIYGPLDKSTLIHLSSTLISIILTEPIIQLANPFLIITIIQHIVFFIERYLSIPIFKE